MSVKAKREEKGLGMYALSQLCGVSQASIWRIENKKQRPMLDTALAIASALNCSLEDLLSPDPEEAERPGA